MANPGAKSSTPCPTADVTVLIEGGDPALQSIETKDLHHTMNMEPPPTSQPSAPARRAVRQRFETLDPVRGGCWPPAPFPPPLLGLDHRLLDKAAGHWLRQMADLILDGEDLNVLFAAEPVEATCDYLSLSPEYLRVVFAAGCFTLGSLRAGKTGASLSAIFARQSIMQVARLDHAALQLGG